MELFHSAIEEKKMKRTYAVVVALVLAGLLTGCRSESDYLMLKGDFEKEQQLNQESASRIATLETDAKKASDQLKGLEDSKKQLEKDKEAVEASLKAKGEELTAARNESEKAKKEKGTLTDELSAAKAQIKTLTNLAEQRAADNKSIADEKDKAIEALKARNEELTTTLADAQAQIGRYVHLDLATENALVQVSRLRPSSAECGMRSAE